MKRSQLKRRSELRRSSALARSGPIARRTELARQAFRARREASKPDSRRDEFKRVRDGICKVCGKRGLVRRHHVVYEQHVRREGGDPWDTRDGLWIGLGDEAGELQTCDCHRRHHDAAQRISIDRLPCAVFDFAAELFGTRDLADAYFDTYYAPRRAQMGADT